MSSCVIKYHRKQFYACMCRAIWHTPLELKAGLEKIIIESFRVHFICYYRALNQRWEREHGQLGSNVHFQINLVVSEVHRHATLASSCIAGHSKVICAASSTLALWSSCRWQTHQWFQFFHAHHKVGRCGLIIQKHYCCVWLTKCGHQISLITLFGAWHLWADWWTVKSVSLGGTRAAGTLVVL